jgi:hypothetical protein
MAAEIVQINPQDFSSQNYQTQDTNLITSTQIATSLSSGSCIELFIYSNKTILNSEYNFINYTVLNNGQSAGTDNAISSIQLDPENILIDKDYSQGIYNLYFNFFNKQIGSDLQQLYISEISSDRTELRLDSTSLTNEDIIEQTNNLIQLKENSPYFLDFYLNFGENILAIANNIQLDNQDPNNITILIKLYEALPSQFNINSTLWVVTLLETPLAYQVTFEPEPIIISDTVSLSGPNFNLNLKDRINNSTISLDYTTLTSTSLTSSRNQLNSLLEEKGIDINLDFTNFNDFIHFSSVEARLENFYYKMSLLEDYSSSIAILDSTTNNNPSSSLAVYEAKISDIITNFDEYDYYLYYSSGSWAWPKTTSQPPYQLATTGSATVLNWFGSSIETSPYYGGIALSASIFDNLNQNNLYYSIPEYLRNDPANEPYQIFVEMVGQLYDNIWIYYKDVSQKYNADNRLESGISKDIVADAIRDFGIKLYQNNFSNDDLYTAFLGLTPEGGLFPFPNITGSLPTPSGFEYVDTLISASNDYIPLDDVNKSLYKRIYHNLPYLLKAKGTLPGLRTLITSYGIPDTVLRINEYGGKDKSNVNDWDYWQNTFNYAFKTDGNNFISSSFNNLNAEWGAADESPETVAFRFKTNGLPTSNIPYSQSLWNKGGDVHIVLRYTGSGYASGSYSGSIANPYNKYAHLDFYPNYTSFPNESASVYLPFFDSGWWSVMVTRDGGTSNFFLAAGNKIYDGGDNGTSLGFYSTSSILATTDTNWYNNGNSYFASSSIITGKIYNKFSGSLQEIRYYSNPISESVFKDYIMNPSSIEGNSLNFSPDQLIFRASLGGELYTGSKSIHPKVTGSWIPTSSFSTGNNFYISNTSSFVPNTEYFFYDQPVVGIRNSISDKIRIENSIIPTGSVLSPFRSLAQDLAISQSYTANTNLLEVAFSPQNEIDQDIMDQIGYFDIGELIGDPRLRSSSATSYPDLDALRNEYFEKYTKNYDLNDFIRLIKFFDNSLFKMIKDFVPARTSLASGIVIKQHLLERNKYPQPQVNNYSTIAYYTSGSNPPLGNGSTNNTPFTFQDISVSGTVAPQWNNYNPGTIENFSGGTGGTMDMFNGINTSPYGPNGTGPENIFDITQSWNEGIVTSLGIVNTIHDSQDEFYDGEFSGSVLTVTTQSLAQSLPLDTQLLVYNTTGSTSITPSSGFISWQSAEDFNPTTGDYSLYIPTLYINEVDANGINIETALSNLSTGDQISFRISASVTDTFTFQITPTVTGTITSIVPVASSVWRINLSNQQNSQATYYSPITSYPIYATTGSLRSNSTTFLNPYLNSVPNFYNSDYNPLINNVFVDRLSSIYQDVDYSTGIATPTNFGLLISGSALKAAVQDSNYTSKRVILPRYEGSKSTSQLLNVWSPPNTVPGYQDEGTYGKIPTIESLKTMVAYCDDIGGWPPERENASAAFVKYLIKSDGTIIIPNTSPNSLTENKFTFESGENVLIQYSGTGNQATPLRKVIRGGTRIEPILYNQSGSMPGGTFLNSITLTDNNVTGSVVSDFQANLRATSFTLNPVSASAYGEICFNQILSTGSAASLAPTTVSATTSYRYKVNSDVITEGINIILNIRLVVTANSQTSQQTNKIAFQIVRLRGGNETILHNSNFYIYNPNAQYHLIEYPHNISFNDLLLNDEYFIKVRRSGNPTGNVYIEATAPSSSPTFGIGSRFTITQTPSPNAEILISNLWISSSGALTSIINSEGFTGTNIIYTTASALVSYYENPTVFQQDISNSGFNQIVLPWSIKYGDEFRFEGKEDRVFVVSKTSIISNGGIAGSPILAVELNQPIPTSGSVNFDQFLIRRYVDDASQVLIEGFKPVGSSGPYIVRPEYIVSELNRDVDDFILILKEKNLI